MSEAQGQTRILRRDVFLKLGIPFEAVGGHTRGLTYLRRSIYETILKIPPPEHILSKTDVSIIQDYDLQQLKDEEMAKTTEILMIDTTKEGFGPSGLYLKTPVSKHFGTEYHTLQEEDWKKCTTKEIWTNEIISRATSRSSIKGINFDYIYESYQQTFDSQTGQLRYDKPKINK